MDWPTPTSLIALYLGQNSRPSRFRDTAKLGVRTRVEAVSLACSQAS
jgi:hypothetical protein